MRVAMAAIAVHVVADFVQHGGGREPLSIFRWAVDAPSCRAENSSIAESRTSQRMLAVDAVMIDGLHECDSQRSDSICRPERVLRS